MVSTFPPHRCVRTALFAPTTPLNVWSSANRSLFKLFARGQFSTTSAYCSVPVLVRYLYLISPMPLISGMHYPFHHLGRRPMRDQQPLTGWWYCRYLNIVHLIVNVTKSFWKNLVLSVQHILESIHLGLSNKHHLLTTLGNNTYLEG